MFWGLEVLGYMAVADDDVMTVADDDVMAVAADDVTCALLCRETSTDTPTTDSIT